MNHISISEIKDMQEAIERISISLQKAHDAEINDNEPEIAIEQIIHVGDICSMLSTKARRIVRNCVV